MKAKIITSVLLGLLIPWIYFLIVTVGSIRTYDPIGNEIIGPRGVIAFIEFNGVIDSPIIYGKAAIVCILFVFTICSIYDLIAKNLAASQS